MSENTHSPKIKVLTLNFSQKNKKLKLKLVRCTNPCNGIGWLSPLKKVII